METTYSPNLMFIYENSTGKSCKRLLFQIVINEKQCSEKVNRLKLVYEIKSD